MKLLIETLDNDSLQVLTEGEGSEKTYRIKGIFAQSQVKNRNGRIYPKSILEREINKYNTEKVKTKRALGELEHPQGPNINLDRCSHLIESLEFQGNDVYGVAKILDTPCGRIVKALIKEGIVLGVSTRSLGTVTNEMVNSDLIVKAVDIVSDPSAPSAFVDSIYESKEWIINGNDIVEVAVSNLRKKLDKSGSKLATKYLKEFINDIGKGK